MTCELASPGTASEDGARFRIALARDLQRGVVPKAPKYPFGIERRRQTPRSVTGIVHGEAQQLDRVIGRHQHQQLLVQVTRTVGVAGVALAVPDGDRRGWSPWQGRGCPDCA